MANNIDKVAQPMGLDTEDFLLENDEFEVEIEDDEDLDEGAEEFSAEPLAFDANLIDTLSAADRATLETDLWEVFQNDKMSRREWEDTLKDGMKLLGLKYEDRTEPWAGACGLYHPMLAEAVVRFQSETVMETFPASGPVKTIIVGVQTPEKIEAAQRVKEDMNYQLTEVMPEYRAEHERMLFSLPLVGCTFKKVYWDPSLGRQVSMFVPAEDVILPYGSTVLNTAERITHRLRKTPYETRVLQAAGFYTADTPLEDAPTKVVDELQQAKDEQTGVIEQDGELITFYEMSVRHTFKELDQDGDDHLPKPYVVTFDDMGTVVAVRRNWLQEDVLTLPRQHFIKYDYIPGLGPYGFGLIHLIGGSAKAASTIQRILVDAGELSSLQGGFKARGLRMPHGQNTVGPNEWIDVDVPSGALRDNLFPIPFKEPSNVLAALLGTIVEDARRLASTADLDISDMSAQAPVGTTMALLERMLKVMSAVQARVHFSFKQELKLLAALIRDNASDEYDYDVYNAPRGTRGTDYAMVEIIPVSDPNAATMSQRIVLYQAVMMLAKEAPQLYNQHELHKAMLEALGVKNLQKLLPSAQEQPPKDPVTEGMDIINGKPAKAFLHQNHDAHLMVHNNMVQDPMLQQQIGQSPNAQLIMGSLLAHINEHLAYQYRAKLEQNLGVPLPPPEQPLPPEVEVQLAPLIAEASKMLLAQNQIAAQQQQEQAMANDPMLQLQKDELDIKRDKVAAEREKAQQNFQLAQDTLAVKKLDIKADLMKHGLTMDENAKQARQKIDADLTKERMRLGQKANDGRVNSTIKLVDIQARRQQAANKPKPSGDKK